jgi:hypothetical protein
MIPGLPMIYRVRISGVGAEESAFPPGPLRFWCSLMGDLECLLISSYGFCDTIVFCVWNWVTLLVCFRGPRATQEQMEPHDLPHLSPHPDLLSWERPWPPAWCVSQNHRLSPTGRKILIKNLDKIYNVRAGGMAWVEDVCLANMKPYVQTPVPPKKKIFKKIHNVRKGTYKQ